MAADVFHALSGKAHPARPKPRRGAAQTSRYRALRARLEAQRSRQATERAPVPDAPEAPPPT